MQLQCASVDVSPISFTHNSHYCETIVKSLSRRLCLKLVFVESIHCATALLTSGPRGAVTGVPLLRTEVVAVEFRGTATAGDWLRSYVHPPRWFVSQQNNSNLRIAGSTRNRTNAAVQELAAEFVEAFTRIVDVGHILGTPRALRDGGSTWPNARNEVGCIDKLAPHADLKSTDQAFSVGLGTTCEVAVSVHK